MTKEYLKMLSRFSRRFIFRFLWLSMGLFVAIILSVWSMLSPGLSAIAYKPSPQLSQRLTTTQSNTASLPTTSESLLQQGIEDYKAARYTDAIQAWTQALIAADKAGETLTKALLHSNLSLANQHLGRWDVAQDEFQSGLVLLSSQPPRTTRVAFLSVLAKIRNTEGRWHWSNGQSDQALRSWQQATVAYTQAQDRRGTILGLINQSKALRALGYGKQTTQRLKQAEQLLENIQEPELEAWSRLQLGTAYRQIGELEQAGKQLNLLTGVVDTADYLECDAETGTASQNQLHSSIKQYPAIDLASLDPSLRSSILLEQGNIERARANKARAIGRDADATSHTQTAFKRYEQSREQAQSTLLRLQSQLNQLSLLVETKAWSAASRLWPTLLPDLEALPPSRHGIYAQLNFAQSLMTLGSQQWELRSEISGRKSQLKYLSSGQVAFTKQINQQLRRAIDQARTLSDPIAESYALGQLGNLYERRGRWADAQLLTEQALHLLDRSQSMDGRYRWEWQLGRLMTQQKKTEAAISEYQAAVATLKTVRRDLLAVDADVQFDFRDNVTPIYRELVELLLKTDGNHSPSQENLNAAIERVNDLQLSEIANFLGCDLNYITPLNQPEEKDPNAAFIYPIILSDRIAVILQLPGQEDLLFKQTFRPRAEVEATLSQLRLDLSEAQNRTEKVVKNAEFVYDWLIRPFKETLSQTKEIKTLVFVQDGPLRNLPMSVLYDRESALNNPKNGYLVNDYAVAVSPRLELFKPLPLPKKLTVFTGGVGLYQEIDQYEFNLIEKLKLELERVAQYVSSNLPLLDKDFTFCKLRQQLNQYPFSAIHIKTHGVFSSDPEQTFIVAYEELIQGQELGDLIQTASTDLEQPLELLVLSACSTAQGDDRAVLGLAGTAVQAGARSTLSTLWEAQDDSNTELMSQFYKALAEPGMTRAKALQTAQVELFKQDYTAPSLWANYILVGNWR